MPAGWVHQTIDLIAYGRTYAHVHRSKDAAAQVMPGNRHRTVGHEWYQRFGRDWDFDCPYPQVAKECIEKLRETYGPDVAEERLSSDSHDLIDRRWDEVWKEQRLYWEGFFAWLLYHPEILERWAEVDVIRGRIKRVVNGNEVWEDVPEAVGEYKMLRREVSRHQKSRLWVTLAHFDNMPMRLRLSAPSTSPTLPTDPATTAWWRT